MRKMLAAVMAGVFVLGSGASIAQTDPAPAPAWTTPSDAEIRQILVNRVDVEHQGVGIVVGVIDPRGRRIVAYGASDKSDPRPLNGETVFEIGSMTKVFTSLLLSDMAQNGEVTLDDPVAKYLPPTVKMPERGGKQITLVDLATHTSGLPRMPNNFTPKNPENPYADYSVDDMYRFLSGYALPRDIGAQYEYSNLGGGLLGHVLARRAGTDYETLVRRRITGPLGMSDTTITLTPGLRQRLAKGHDATLEPAANWDIPTLAGAGALRSDARDILTFLAAELNYIRSPLQPAMRAQIESRRPTGTANLSVALAWHILSPPAKDEIVWHNGGTGGYSTFMGFDPKTRVGVVVLTNVGRAGGADDIGFHILDGAPLAKLPPPPVARHAIRLDPQMMARVVGRYQIAPGVFLTVTQDGGRMFVQRTGQTEIEIYPEGPTDFFMKGADVQLTFPVGPDGKVTSVVVRQNGASVTVKRADDFAGR